MNGRPWRLLLAALLIASVVAVGAVLPGATPAQIPAGHSRIVVRVGGERVLSTRGIAPLAGVEFGLFVDRPDPDTFNDQGFTSDTPIAGSTCVSQADGRCTITVPTPTGGTAASRRRWVAPVAGPPAGGWFNNREFQTAPLTPGANRVQNQYVFQTPPLEACTPNPCVSGTTYAGGGFMNNPTPAVQGTGNSEARRTASGGEWTLSKDNPPHPPECGLDVALVVDLSTSMRSPVDLVTQPAGRSLKNAMDAFVEALRGTPSSAALFTFSTNSPAVFGPNPNSGLIPVATFTQAQRFRDLYRDWQASTAEGFTNWDAALDAVARRDTHFDLVVFITDGLPTVFGIPANTATPSGFTRFLEMENSIASANVAKHLQSRVVAVGVGPGVDAPGADRNLMAISGITPFRPGPPSNIANADFFQEQNFGQVSDLMRDLLLEACAPTVSVIKQIIPNGDTDTSDAYTPDPGWVFHAQTNTGTVAPASATTDRNTGALNFDLSFEAPGPAGVTINHDQKAGYTSFPVSCPNGLEGTCQLNPAAPNAVCENKSENNKPVPVTNAGPNGFHVDVGLQDAVSCVVYNQAPPDRADLSILKTASAKEIEPGSDITYTLKVTNHGPNDAQNVVVRDPLEGLTFVSASPECAQEDGQVVCHLASLAAGDSHTFMVVAHVPSAHRGGVVNTATVTSDTPDPYPGNNSDTEDVPSPAPADLAISKVASSTSVTPGSQVIYTLVVTNHGPHDAHDVTVTDPLAPQLVLVAAQPSQGQCEIRYGLVCRLGTIRHGASAHILVTARVAAGASGTVANTAHVESGETDPKPGNNRDRETINVHPGPAQPSADLGVTKQASRLQIRAGGTVTFQLRVTNHGPSTATHVHITDTSLLAREVLSAHPSQGTCHIATVLTCSLGTIHVNGHANISVVVRMPQAGAIRNTVTVTGAERDPDLSNNMASAEVGTARAARRRPAPRPRPTPRPPRPKFTG